MNIGVVFPQTDIGNDPAAIRDYAQAVEAMGYTHILAYDHVLGANRERYRDLTGNLGNIALLQRAAGHGLIDAALAERCRTAYREFRRLQHGLRLNGAQYARVPRAEVQAHVDAVSELWQTVLRPAS